MDTLNRYLNEVKKYLPRKDSKDIIMELRSSILDEFEQTNKTDRDLEDIILKLGSPRSVAQQYDNKPFLSKSIEPLYFLLLKVVTGAITLGLIVANVTTLIFSDEEFSAVAVITKIALTIPDILMAIISAIGMVTIIILIIDRKVEFKEPEFRISDLPKTTKPEYEISKIEAIASIVAGTIFLVFINLVDLTIKFEGQRIFADLSVAISIASVFLIIEILSTTFVVISGYRTVLSKYAFVIRQLLNASFLWYLSTIHIFNPNQTIIPNFMGYLLRLVFFALAIMSVVELRKIRKEAN